VIKFEQFNKKNDDVHPKCCALNPSTNNLVNFPATDRQTLVSAEEVGHWVDLLMEMPEDSCMTDRVEKDDYLELAAKLVNEGLI
jgi:hypothetical protein